MTMINLHSKNFAQLRDNNSVTECKTGSYWTPFAVDKRIPSTKGKLGRIDQALANSQYCVALIGDSWLSPQGSFQTFISAYLGAIAGGNAAAGSGWRSFATLGISGGASATWIGTWTNRTIGEGYGVGLSDKTSSDVATPGSATITATGTTIVLHYLKKPGGGKFTWSVDGGTSTEIDTENPINKHAVITISGLSIASHSIVCTVTSAGTNGVTLIGCDVRLSANGPRLHCLAVDGTKVSHWITPDATVWQDGLKSLGPDLVLIKLATNDRLTNVDPTVYGEQLNELTSRIKVACPDSDIVLITTPEDGASATYGMSLYADQVRSIAVKNGIVFIDWFNAFGTYTQSNALGLWENTTHPNPSGYRALLNVLASSLYPQSTLPYKLSSGSGGISTGGNIISSLGVYCGIDDILSVNGRAVIRAYANGEITLANGSGSTLNRLKLRGGCDIVQGSGSPEGVITATIGSLYLRLDGGAGSTLWVKESSTGNTGWISK